MSLARADVEQFAESFVSALPDGWQLAANGRERFGSWDWTAFTWPDRRRPRAWVVLAVTPTEAEAQRATRVLSEGWAAAEIRDRFTRSRLVGVELSLATESADDRRRVMVAQTTLAVTQALQLRAGDIAFTYTPLQVLEPERLGPLREQTSSVAEQLVPGADWASLFRGRRELAIGEVVEALGRPPAVVLELALRGVRDGELRIEQRGRDIYLLAVVPPELDS